MPDPPKFTFGPAASSGAASGSLFGATSNTPPTGSLFGGGNANNNTSSSAGSLFGGGTSNTGAPEQKSLFGGGAPSSTPAFGGGSGFSFGKKTEETKTQAPATTGASTNSGSLFGGGSSSTPGGMSLFGGGGNNSTTPGASTPAGGLFGAKPAAPSAGGEKAGGAGNVFGGSFTPSAQPSGSLFGNLGNKDASSAQGSGASTPQANKPPAALSFMAVQAGSAEELMQWLPMQQGDMVFVDAGTVHAIGPGLTLLEVQQTCDVTYRLYDYGRPRELHLEAGLAVVKTETAAGRVRPVAMNGFTRLIESKYFVVDRFDLPAGEATELQVTGAACVVGLGGAGTVDGVALEAGTAVVLAPGRVTVGTGPGVSFALCFEPQGRADES